LLQKDKEKVRKSFMQSFSEILPFPERFKQKKFELRAFQRIENFQTFKFDEMLD
jgi:hypothetical protein